MAAQRALCEQVMRLLGFDFEAGRLDVSTHPFCGGVPEDVRMTTRFREDDFLGSLMGTIHETGHGRYEQNLPRELARPAGGRRALDGAARKPEPELRDAARQPPRASSATSRRWCAQALGAQPAFEARNLHRLLTRVKPGLIRVDADEVTYPAHVILRYEIERPLIEGEIEPEDIPALWDAKMMELLGVDTRGNFKDGPLQDVHWPEGLFGYFPCYSLGAMYAAQWFAAMRRAIPDLDARIGARRPGAGLRLAARQHLARRPAAGPPTSWPLRASGEALNPAHFRPTWKRATWAEPARGSSPRARQAGSWPVPASRRRTRNG